MTGVGFDNFFKVDLVKEAKRQVGKPSILRPEVDLSAFKPGSHLGIALEVKSYLYLPSFYVEYLEESFEMSQGHCRSSRQAGSGPRGSLGKVPR